jgi:Family of unknown function (DUF5670)
MMNLLRALTVALLTLWILGVGLHMLGGLIHLLLALAVAAVLLRVILGRRVA